MIVGQNMLADVSGMLYAVCEGQLLAKRVILVRLLIFSLVLQPTLVPNRLAAQRPKLFPDNAFNAWIGIVDADNSIKRGSRWRRWFLSYCSRVFLVSVG